MFWLLYRIDFDVLGTSINAEQNPEAKEQIEKIRTLTVSIHQEEVKSLRILQHWDVFIMSSRFSCFQILRCTCRYCKCNTGIISFIYFSENSKYKSHLFLQQDEGPLSVVEEEEEVQFLFILKKYDHVLYQCLNAWHLHGKKFNIVVRKSLKSSFRKMRMTCRQKPQTVEHFQKSSRSARPRWTENCRSWTDCWRRKRH